MIAEGPIRKGICVCWSNDPRWATLPIINLPKDAIKVRRRIRHDCVAKCFIKRENGTIEEWILQPVSSDPFNQPISGAFALMIGLFRGANRNE
jgi:hypothetical protein